MYLLLDSGRKLLDLVLAVDLGLLRTLSAECLLLVAIVELAADGVVVSSLPEALGSLGLHDLEIGALFLVVVLDVAVVYDVVLTLSWLLDGLASFAVLGAWLGSLLWGSEVMVLHVDVADDVVVSESVLSGSEVPWLLLGVVWSILKTSQLVLKVQNVISLLVTERAVLVLGENFDEVLILHLTHLLLTRVVRVSLRDWVVHHILLLDELRSDLLVWLWHTLELLLASSIVLKILLPLSIAIIDSSLLGSFSHVR